MLVLFFLIGVVFLVVLGDVGFTLDPLLIAFVAESDPEFLSESDSGVEAEPDSEEEAALFSAFSFLIMALDLEAVFFFDEAALLVSIFFAISFVDVFLEEDVVFWANSFARTLAIE